MADEHIETTTQEELVTIKYKDQEFTVPKQVQEAFNSKANAEVARKVGSFQLENQTLKEQLQALQLEKEEAIKASMTEAQLRKYENEKELNELKAAKAELDSYRSQIKKEKIENSLYQELGKYNDMYNPTQVFNLLKSQYDFDLVTTNGTHTVVAKKGDNVLPLQDAVTALRNDPLNSNLWVDSLLSGNQTNKTGKNSNRLTKEDLKKMTPSEIVKAQDDGLLDHLLKQ